MSEQIYVTTALQSWKIWTDRLGKVFDSLNDEQMLAEIAPGRNRPVYLLGHLTVVHDAMVSQMRLGEAAYPELRPIFLDQPDRAAGDTPTVAELRRKWTAVSARLAELFEKLTPTQWLERHGSVSEEDFAKEPHRNRLAILLNRTGHASYHLGQLMLKKKA